MVAFVDRLLDDFHGRTPIRAGSLIVTIFGDAVVPRGGSLWLGSLFEIARAFRISDGLVRTAMSRLVADNWLERWKVGRNSFYRLTEPGRTTFAAATERIYGAAPRRWNGSFDLVLLDNGGAGSSGGDERSALRAGFEAAGYGALAPGLFVSPVPSAAAVDGIGGSSGTIRLAATPADAETARRIAVRAWPIGEIEARYRRFLESFSPVLSEIEGGAAFGDLDALLVRILLIHEYRRIILRDPLLPPELLPVPWAGTEARHVCGVLYRRLVPFAERWLDGHATDDRGPLPPPDRSFARRFNDLR